ncbi:MAG: hypothetical protein AAGJ35_08315, partial [Myxococcota bacterium]
MIQTIWNGAWMPLFFGVFFFAFLMLDVSQASAERVLITVVRANITPKKTRFRRWDTGFGKMTYPDVFVVLDAKGERLTTPLQKNTIQPRWNTSRLFTMSNKDQIYIKVFDKDRFSDDLIAKTSVSLAQLVKNPSLTFGKVEKLLFQVKFLDSPAQTQPKKVEKSTKSAKSVPRRVLPVVPPRPQGRPLPFPSTPLRSTAMQGLPQTGLISARQFCYAVQRQTLYCMQKKAVALRSQNMPSAKAQAQFILALVVRVQQSLKQKDPRIEQQCTQRMSQEK